MHASASLYAGAWRSQCSDSTVSLRRSRSTTGPSIDQGTSWLIAACAQVQSDTSGETGLFYMKQYTPNACGTIAAVGGYLLAATLTTSVTGTLCSKQRPD